MSLKITKQEQPKSDTPKRSSIHALKEDCGRTIDEIALRENTEPNVVGKIVDGPVRRPDNSKSPIVDDSQDPPIIQHEHSVPNPPKNPIQCLHSAKSLGDMAGGQPDLLFTHGAGGDLHAPAVANFVNGFVSMASRKTIFAFQGNMNLNSRVSMFNTILDQGHIPTKEHSIHIRPTCLGGRSMGARAAVMAAREDTTHLVLVSYPLHTDKAVRDQILLDIPKHVKVIFVTGDHDEMCDLARLDDVRGKMQCPTWRIVVHGTDHGMNSKPKSATEEMQRATGRVVSAWLDDADPDKMEGRIFWDAEGEVVRWSGWSDDSGYMMRDSHGQVVHASSSPEGDVQSVKATGRGRKPATKAKKGQSKSNTESAKGTQPAKKRKVSDQDTNKESGGGGTKRKSSKRQKT